MYGRLDATSHSDKNVILVWFRKGHRYLLRRAKEREEEVAGEKKHDVRDKMQSYTGGYEK